MLSPFKTGLFGCNSPVSRRSSDVLIVLGQAAWLYGSVSQSMLVTIYERQSKGVGVHTHHEQCPNACLWIFDSEHPGEYGWNPKNWHGS